MWSKALGTSISYYYTQNASRIFQLETSENVTDVRTQVLFQIGKRRWESDMRTDAWRVVHHRSRLIGQSPANGMFRFASSGPKMFNAALSCALNRQRIFLGHWSDDTRRMIRILMWIVIARLSSRKSRVWEVVQEPHTILWVMKSIQVQNVDCDESPAKSSAQVMI